MEQEFYDVFVKSNSSQWPADKLVANVDENVGFTGNDYVAKTLLSTPAIEVRVLNIKSNQETVYEKAVSDLSFFVLEGSAMMALGYEDIEISEASVVVVPEGMLWGIKNNNSSPLVVLQTMKGNEKLV